MPFIGAKVSVPVGAEKENAIKTRLGRAISLIPGKSESWLMVEVAENARLYFKGQDGPLAFVEVKLLGQASRKDSEALAKEITEILAQELNIPPTGVYVKFETVSEWGWNGSLL